MHPRLLTTLVLLDPVFQFNFAPVRVSPARASTFRRDLWQSRDDAEAFFLKNGFYQRWDNRVLKLWLKYGIRDLPTAIYGPSLGQSQTAVTLTTTKHQEVFTFL